MNTSMFFLLEIHGYKCILCMLGALAGVDVLVTDCTVLGFGTLLQILNTNN